MLRQRFLLLAGPWLAICGVGFVVAKLVQQVSNRLFPITNVRSLGHSSVAMRMALSNMLKGSLIRLGALTCIEVLEIAAKVVALGLLVLLVTQVAVQGDDSFSAAVDRLRALPGVANTLLKLFAIAVVLGLGAGIVAAVPAALIVPLRLAVHRSPQFFRWVSWLSSSVARVLFVVCMMPFVLNLVWRLQRPSRLDDEAPQDLLMPALRYAAVALGVEVMLGLLTGIIQRQLTVTPGIGWTEQSLFGLAATLLTALPTVVCMIAISLMVLGAEVPATEAEPA